VICDVGSDHGALPVFLLKQGLCRRALISDIHPLPLSRAKLAVKEAGVESQAEFFLTDGIDTIVPHKPDAYVIAGMGGETIAGILSRALAKLSSGVLFVLQPMSRARILRQFLYENGFFVEREEIVLENGKTFPIFCVRYDAVQRKHEEEFYFLGEFLPHLRSDAAKAYFQKLLFKTQSKIAGKMKAGLSCEKESREEAVLISVLEEFQ